ncbi:MAG TPA: chromosomal replication initiator protein DnaA [Firmicutes bacterium]|nr:chromosomal replication initiator protein DnaA [Bacillota bacterium]
MSSAIADIWSQVLGRVKEELDAPSYEFLLEGTRPISAENGTLVVGVPSQFARDWLEVRMLPELEELLFETTGRAIRLKLVLSTGYNHPGQSRELSQTSPARPAVPGQQSLSFNDPQPARPLSQVPPAGAGAQGGSGTAGTVGGNAGEMAAGVAAAAPSASSATAAPSSSPSPAQVSVSVASGGSGRRFELTGGVLNPRYTFDSFVVGSSNHFAHAACLAVGKLPGKEYNPLFLYGGVGLGKTHLMHAIGHYVQKYHKGLNVIYVSCERFTNDMVTALMNNTMPQFHSTYRMADVLLMDDVQFIAGKEKTQEEIFYTFNTLYEAGKQIVISSDRPPREIPTLEDRLRSRFEWGLTADIQAPDLETRIAILRKKAEEENYKAPHDVLSFIAKYISSNIRELEGALIRVVAYADLHGRLIDCDLAAEALKDTISAVQARKITIPLIQEIVADYFNLKTVDMRSRKKSREIAYPRQIAMYLARELTDASLPKIGEEFGNRDHTTVMHAYKVINNEVLSNPSLMATINELKARLNV